MGHLGFRACLPAGFYPFFLKKSCVLDSAVLSGAVFPRVQWCPAKPDSSLPRVCLLTVLPDMLSRPMPWAFLRVLYWRTQQLFWFQETLKGLTSFKKLINYLSDVQLIWNAGLVSGIQQSDSVVHKHILFQILFYYSLLQGIEYSFSGLYIETLLFILYRVVCVC